MSAENTAPPELTQEAPDAPQENASTILVQEEERNLHLHFSQATDFLWLNDLINKPRKLLWINFMIGMARGLGFAVGLTLLAGLTITLALRAMGHVADVPLIGKYLAELFSEIQEQMALIKK